MCHYKSHYPQVWNATFGNGFMHGVIPLDHFLTHTYICIYINILYIYMYIHIKIRFLIVMFVFGLEIMQTHANMGRT